MARGGAGGGGGALVHQIHFGYGSKNAARGWDGCVFSPPWNTWWKPWMVETRLRLANG